MQNGALEWSSPCWITTRPQFISGSAQESRHFHLVSLVSTALETFGIVSCQLRLLTLQCILASFSVLIPCFPRMPNWYKTTSPARQLTPVMQDGLGRRGTRWPKAFPALHDPCSQRGWGERWHQGHKPLVYKNALIVTICHRQGQVSRIVCHRSLSSPSTFALERKEPKVRILTMFITEQSYSNKTLLPGTRKKAQNILLKC